MKNILNSYLQNKLSNTHIYYVIFIIISYNISVSFIIILFEQRSNNFVVNFYSYVTILLIQSLSSSVVFFIALKLNLRFYNFIIFYGVIRYCIQIIMTNGRFSNLSLSWLLDVILFIGLFVGLFITQKK